MITLHATRDKIWYLPIATFTIIIVSGAVSKVRTPERETRQ